MAHELWNEERLSIVDGDGAEAEALVDAMARPYPALLAGAGATTEREGDGWVLTWTPAEGVTEVRWPSRRGEVHAEAEGAVVDVKGDRVYVQAEAGASAVRLTLRAANPP